jgi:cell division protein FtsQ
MNKTLINTILWSLVLLLTLLTLGFVESKQDERVCTDIQIQIDHSSGNFFVDEEEVNAMVYHEMDTVLGRPISRIEATKLEHKLNNHPNISQAEVFKTLQGELVVEVIQRTPIVRIFNTLGESYYLDSTGRVMPPSKKYTSRVFVANGQILDKFLDVNQLNVASLSDSLARILLVDDIFKFADFIRQDPFWSLQIEQLYVNKDSEVELIPRVGNHRIVFGDATELKGKFKKLKIFYKKGLAKTGWNEYSVINLKFADQVVCTKRN